MTGPRRYCEGCRGKGEPLVLGVGLACEAGVVLLPRGAATEVGEPGT